MLFVESMGWAGGEFGVDQAVDGLRVRYSLGSSADREILNGVQWADWDRTGRLLPATRSGKLQVRDLEGDRPVTVFEEDLSVLQPNPVPTPPEARRW